MEVLAVGETIKIKNPKTRKTNEFFKNKIVCIKLFQFLHQRDVDKFYDKKLCHNFRLVLE